MGKRKSKTGKQKQAKAAGKKFGVSVKKGREAMKNVLSSSSSTTVVATSKKEKKMTTKPPPKRNKPFPHHAKNRTEKRLPNSHTNSDFGKEMQSALERSRSTHKKEKVAPAITILPATLIVDDKHKSTQRLMDEATNCVSTGMQGIGMVHAFGHVVTKSSSRFQGAVEIEEEVATNPWAALHVADSDDEEEEVAPPPAVPLFQFAPPSFGINHDIDPDL